MIPAFEYRKTRIHGSDVHIVIANQYTKAGKVDFDLYCTPGNKLVRMSEAIKQYKNTDLDFVYGFNGGIFNMKTGQAYGEIVDDGRILIPSLSSPRTCLIFNKYKNIRIERVTDLTKMWDNKHLDFVLMGFGGLVSNGRVNITALQEGVPRSIVEGRHPRTAAGMLYDGRLLMMTVDGRSNNRGMTLKELAETGVALGCKTMVNLDGGGSTEIARLNVYNGQVSILNKPSDGAERKLPNFIFITVKHPAVATRTGVTTASLLNLRSMPSLSAKIIDKITRNSKVSIVDEHDGWYKIESWTTSSGTVKKIGWVFQDYVRIIPS